MKLRDWIEKTGTKQTDLASIVGCSRARITQICAGEIPAARLAVAIVDATKGKVTLNDLMRPSADTVAAE